MDKLNFYTVDLSYVNYLKDAETQKRGFSRVPNMEYGDKRKPKFLCGVVLEVGEIHYFVPVTSYKQQKPDNFLIKASNGQVVSSLRFNYMFPVPLNLVQERKIADEPDLAYRALLSQELQYCIKQQEAIRNLADRTYRRVLLGKNPGLMVNSCDFRLLEEKCTVYTHDHFPSKAQPSVEQKPSVLEKLKKPAAENTAKKSVQHKDSPER